MENGHACSALHGAACVRAWQVLHAGQEIPTGLAEDNEDHPVWLYNPFNKMLCIGPVQKCVCVHKHLYTDL